MYQVGDQVVYGIHGVCVILAEEERRMDKKRIWYFVLEPADQPGSRCYVPRDNPVALSKLRPILDNASLDALLRSERIRQNCWIEDENKRKLRYRELIVSCEREALLQMVYTLHKRRAFLNDTGRKFHLCDENFLHDAEKLLTSEFSRVLGISPGEVGAYISNMFDSIE